MSLSTSISNSSRLKLKTLAENFLKILENVHYNNLLEQTKILFFLTKIYKIMCNYK